MKIVFFLFIQCGADFVKVQQTAPESKLVIWIVFNDETFKKMYSEIKGGQREDNLY